MRPWTRKRVRCCCNASPHHITSHHITSHHITSHHITSHHITPHHITPHHITSHHITSHHNDKTSLKYTTDFDFVPTLPPSDTAAASLHLCILVWHDDIEMNSKHMNVCCWHWRDWMVICDLQSTCDVLFIRTYIGKCVLA